MWVCSLSHWSASWLLAGPWTSQLACHADPSDWVGQEPSPRGQSPSGIPGPSTLALGPQPHTPGPASCHGWPRAGPGDAGPDTGSKVHTHTRGAATLGVGEPDQEAWLGAQGAQGSAGAKGSRGRSTREARAAETCTCAGAHATGTRATAQLQSLPPGQETSEAGCGPGHQRLLPGPQEGRGGSYELATCDPRRTTRGWALWLPSLPARPLLSRELPEFLGASSAHVQLATSPSPGRRPAPVPHPGVTPITQSLNLQLPEPAHLGRKSV